MFFDNTAFRGDVAQLEDIDLPSSVPPSTNRCAAFPNRAHRSLINAQFITHLRLASELLPRPRIGIINPRYSRDAARTHLLLKKCRRSFVAYLAPIQSIGLEVCFSEDRYLEISIETTLAQWNSLPASQGVKNDWCLRCHYCVNSIDWAQGFRKATERAPPTLSFRFPLN